MTKELQNALSDLRETLNEPRLNTKKIMDWVVWGNQQGFRYSPKPSKINFSETVRQGEENRQRLAEENF